MYILAHICLLDFPFSEKLGIFLRETRHLSQTLPYPFSDFVFMHIYACSAQVICF